jgi:hypothetical protein
MVVKGAKIFIGFLFSIIFLILLITSVKADTLCSYQGPDLSPDFMRLTNFRIEGPSQLKEGDSITVKFTLQNYGQYDVTLGTKGIFAAARDPSNIDTSFGFSYTKTTYKSGDTLSIDVTRILDKAGTWVIWPSYQYTLGKETKTGQDKWHECKLTVEAAKIDSDQDGIEDSSDNCPKNYNPKQEDIDGDDIGDACDSCDDRDSDNDKIKNCIDKCPTEKESYNSYQDEDGCPDKNPEEKPKLDITVFPQNPKKGEKFKVSATASGAGITAIDIIINGKKVKECKGISCSFEGVASEDSPAVGGIALNDVGNLGSAGRLPWGEQPSACRDTDDGRKPSVAGSVTVGTTRIEDGVIYLPPTYFDTCVANNSIIEYFCEGDAVKNATQGCGICTRAPGMVLEDGSVMPLSGDYCECRDSDGRNYFTQGTTTTYSGLTQDHCYDSNMVIELYCDENNMPASESYSCPNASTCLNGACRCSDTDGGREYYTRGTAVGHTDECLSHGRLKEYFCGPSGVENESVICPCEEGACRCIDMDDGRNYYQYGSIVFDPLDRNDECLNNITLREYYCDGNNVRSDDINCYVCEHGRCKCDDSDGGINYMVKGKTSVGNEDYCFNTKTLVEYSVTQMGNDCMLNSMLVDCRASCENGACQETCSDGIQNHGETGIDCGGPCPAQCTPCISRAIVPGHGSEAGKFSISDPYVLYVAIEAVEEYADCVRDDRCRSGLPVVTYFPDYSRVNATMIASKADTVMEAVSYYVDRHMQYMYDSGDGPVQSARETVLNSQFRSGTLNNGTSVDICPNDYCGDCEDFCHFRGGLMRSLGIKADCMFCTDHYDGYWGGGHTFNVVNYQGKWRIMDYGAMGSKFLTDWGEHNPHNLYNDERGVYWCPDWKDNLGDGTWSGGIAGCDKTSPSSYTWNYVRGERCPPSWNGYWSYRTDTCP